MRQDSLSEGIARQLKGRAHATGTFVSYESRGGRIGTNFSIGLMLRR